MRTKDRVDIARRLDRLRLEAGYTTVSQFARVVGRPQNTVGRWLAGACYPDVPGLRALSRALGVSVDRIVFRRIPTNRHDAAPHRRTS